MADKEAIELGQRLYRLMENEDFTLTVLAQMESQIANCKLQLEISGSVVDVPQHLANNYSQRLDEIFRLRSWIDDEIERGGKEKIKQEITEAKEGDLVEILP